METCKRSLRMATCVSNFFRCFEVTIETTIAEIELLTLIFNIMSEDGRSVSARSPCEEETILT